MYKFIRPNTHPSVYRKTYFIYVYKCECDIYILVIYNNLFLFYPHPPQLHLIPYLKIYVYLYDGVCVCVYSTTKYNISPKNMYTTYTTKISLPISFAHMCVCVCSSVWTLWKYIIIYGKRNLKRDRRKILFQVL